MSPFNKCRPGGGFAARTASLRNCLCLAFQHPNTLFQHPNTILQHPGTSFSTLTSSLSTLASCFSTIELSQQPNALLQHPSTLSQHPNTLSQHSNTLPYCCSSVTLYSSIPLLRLTYTRAAHHCECGSSPGKWVRGPRCTWTRSDSCRR